MKRLLCCAPLLLHLLAAPVLLFAEQPEQKKDARLIVQQAVDYWRDQTSHTRAEMTVNRPDWQRTMAFEAWTRGRKQSLVRFTAPAKDRGSASLTLDKEMWSFAPKINKVIKIPASMMGQSWMGSDFSYQDLAKDDEILEEYKHALTATEEHEGLTVYVIDAIPLESAPVVWGKEVLKIREDNVMLEQSFFDQDFKLVKKLTAETIGTLGGKLIATRLRMTKADNKDEWTEVRHTAAEFNITLPETVFSLSNLRNPRI